MKAGKSDGKESKKKQRERFNDLLDSCLNAPSPVRALKEKDRIRLAEMEKLGVITKEREREIEQEKAREKGGGNDRETNFSHAMLERNDSILIESKIR
ncbi:hypothetical protein R1flu_016735 [Riccia fluitans]|uniref:Uncharacterized protein n=1 Tax=Riccia fluitans TaxID=41844 RepID=A0ABD1YQS6_9MARC